MSATYINGVNLRTRGFVAERMPRWLDLPTRTLQTASVLGLMGDAVVGVQGYRGRALGIEGTILGTTYAERLSQQDTLKGLVGGQASRITRYDGTTWRTVTGVLQDGPITPIGTEMRTRGARAVLQFICPDAAWRDINPSIRHVTVANAPHNVNTLGTAPSGPLIEIMGGATNPEFQVLRVDGSIRYRLRFSTTLTTSQSIAIDLRVDPLTGLRPATIWHYSSGVRTDGSQYLNEADLPDLARLVLDPHDGDLNSTPYVLVTAGTARVIWWRRWL